MCVCANFFVKANELTARRLGEKKAKKKLGAKLSRDRSFVLFCYARESNTRIQLSRDIF